MRASARKERTRKSERRNPQRGGFTIGLIVGLLVGIALALGVALYVTKAPNPFVTKVPPHSAVQDAAEAERNRNWDPNAPLAGKNPARPSTPTASQAPSALPPPAEVPTAAAGALPSVAAASRPSKASTATSTRDPAAILGERTTASISPSTPVLPAAPLPATRVPPPLSTGAGSDPFTYFVQAGAYSRTEDAEQQRARLAMLGIESRLTEREQAGRTVYRVRVGPFDRKDDADSAKEKLSDAGVDSALVRVQK